ncbi:MAG TPA: Maf family protein [Polyangiaceae bacterium]
MSEVLSVSSPLVLGSASPRRRDILAGLGIPLRVAPANVPETELPNESPLAYVERIVLEKLRGSVPALASGAGGALLVADTIVVLDGDVLGKPADVADAVRLLGRLAGRTHRVFTRYAIAAAGAPLEPVAARTVESSVTLRAASAAEIEGYARTGEGLDKAGAYAIQGIGAFLVARIEGSYTNVVGLPACEVVEDLLRTGLLERFP